MVTAQIKKPPHRPRTTTPPDEDLEKLGEEMIQWVTLNQPMHLSQWYTIHKRFTYNQWKAMIQIPLFLPYYEQALKMVGIKYINGDVNPSIAQRFLRVYFKDLKEEEDETLYTKMHVEVETKKHILDHAAKLKSFEMDSISEDIKNQYDALMNQLTSLQSPR